MPYSVYARNRQSGREYALPERYFGHLPTRDEAEIARDWYLNTASSAAHSLVDVYVIDQYAVSRRTADERDLTLV